MLKRFYQRFIDPATKDPDIFGRKLVLNWLLVGLFGFTIITAINSFISLVILHEKYVVTRFFLVIIVLGFWLMLYSLSRRERLVPITEFGIILVFLLAAILVLYRWGPINPTGLVLLSLVVVMAGILLGARYSLYAAILVTLLLIGLEYAHLHQYTHPDLKWMSQTPTIGDIFVYSSIYAVMALISWLFNRQMELSLKRARRSEASLKRQKALLEIRVEERTRQLQIAQMEKVQQFYRFAELGHISTALFHDLANHLVSVSLDIEGLKKGSRTEIVRRIQENIGYIDSVVRSVRQQLQGKYSPQRFDLLSEIEKIIKLLSYQVMQDGVKIYLESNSKSKLFFVGDLTRFRQVMTNLISNAAESYSGQTRKKDRVVSVRVDKLDGELVIKVGDTGIGIPPRLHQKIYEPFYSTKTKGVGIGLFMVKKIVHEDLKGELSFTSNKKEGTTFTVSLPNNKVVARVISK